MKILVIYTSAARFESQTVSLIKDFVGILGDSGMWNFPVAEKCEIGVAQTCYEKLYFL